MQRQKNRMHKRFPTMSESVNDGYLNIVLQHWSLKSFVKVNFMKECLVEALF